MDMELSELPLPPGLPSAGQSRQVSAQMPVTNATAFATPAWQKAMEELQKVQGVSATSLNQNLSMTLQPEMSDASGYDLQNCNYWTPVQDWAYKKRGNMMYYGTGYEAFAPQSPSQPWGWGVGPRQKARSRPPATVIPQQSFSTAPRPVPPVADLSSMPTHVLGKAQYGNPTTDSHISDKPSMEAKGKSFKIQNGKTAESKAFQSGNAKKTLDPESWPLKLKNYATRAFGKCKSEFDKNQVEIILKGKITAAIETNRLWTMNWDDEPLPTVYSETLEKSRKDAEERQKNLRREREEFLREKEQEKNRRASSGFNLLSLGDKMSGSTRSAEESSKYDSRKFDEAQRSSSGSKNAQTKASRKDNDKQPNKTQNSDFLALTSSVKQCKSIIDRLSFTKGGKGDDVSSKDSFNSSSPAQKRKKVGKCSRQLVDDDPDCDPSVLQKRARRFGGEPSAKARKTDMSMNSTLFADNSYEDWQQNAVEGTCTDVEKAYFRLTSAPDPSTVRPVYVLRKSLELIKKHWITKQDYRYACDQLKSLRQDLTVQCIRTFFTIEVYETHARIALEIGDHEEFNQCQTQLMSLYAEFPDAEYRSEFIGYKLLYQVFTENVTDINDTVRTLNSVERQDPVISHAVRVISAWNTRNFTRLFRLFRSAPRMSPYVMEWCLAKERIAAFKAIVKAFRPELPLEYVQTTLCFDAIPEVKAFLKEQNAVVHGNVLDCKASFGQMS